MISLQLIADLAEAADERTFDRDRAHRYIDTLQCRDCGAALDWAQNPTSFTLTADHCAVNCARHRR